MRIDKRTFARCLALGHTTEIAFIAARRGLPIGRKRVAPSLQTDSGLITHIPPNPYDQYRDEILRSLRKRPIKIPIDLNRYPLLQKYLDGVYPPFKDKTVEILTTGNNTQIYSIAFNRYGKRFIIDFEIGRINVILGQGLEGRPPTPDEITIVTGVVMKELLDPSALVKYFILFKKLTTLHNPLKP